MPGAIWFPADPTNYYSYLNHAGVKNNPKGIVLHTPQEPANSYPSTPHYFQNPNLQASTHYFSAYTGDIYQMVNEEDAAIANGVKNKPYPSWADPLHSLNWQSVNVEIEGYDYNIQDTLIRGRPQWNGLLSLLSNRAAYYNIPLDREHIIGHYQVADDRSDPGAGFPWDALINDLQGGSDMFVRFNGVASYFTGKTYPIGPNNIMALWTDFPALPHNAKAVELDVRISPTSNGEVVFKDGNKAYADALSTYKPQSIVRVIPGQNGIIYFDVNKAPITFFIIGIVGFWV